MARAPAFQFYANDFMDATRLWEAIAVGLYVRCLCIQWTQGSIPADRKVLARAIHCERAELESCWDVLGPKFIEQGDGTLKNRRLEEVRARQIEVSEERSKAGKAGAIAKANAKSLAADLLQAKAKQRKVKEKEKVEREDECEGPKAHEPEIIPAGMSLELFQAIKRWEQYRREKRNTLTPSGRVAFVKKCEAWGDLRAIAAIDHSIAQGWTGCFEPKQNGTGQAVDRDERKRLVLEAVAEHHRSKRGDGQ